MQPGTKVQWTHVSTRGRTMSMSLREGTLESIKDGMATVRMKSVRHMQVDARRLRTLDQPTQIGEFVEAMREAHR